MNYICIETVTSVIVRSGESEHYYRVRDENFEEWVKVENHSKHNTMQEVLDYCLEEVDHDRKVYMVKALEEAKYLSFDGKGYDFTKKKLFANSEIKPIYKKVTQEDGVTIHMIG